MKFSPDVSKNPSKPQVKRIQPMDVHKLCAIMQDDTSYKY